jgi:iron complex outermembrane recepter protein
MTTKPWMLAFASVATIAIAQSASAQTTPTSDATATVDTADIIVTANRREQKLQDVPLSVTAISGEALRTQGITSVSDLGAGRIPGLAVTPLFGSQVSIAVNFRGLGNSDAAQATQDSPAAFYIDGIYYARSQGLSMDLVTPERIEVLRGPQGQLFGRNAEAGVIQVVSRRPSGTLNGDFSGGFGNYGAYNVKGRLDLPELAGFKVQLSGVYRRHDGYVKNIRNPNLQNFTPIQNPLSSIRLPQGNYDGDFGTLETYGGRIAIERDFGDVNIFYAYDNSYAQDSQGFTNFVNSPGGVGSLNNPNGLPVTLAANVFTFPAGPAGAPRVFSQSPVDGYPSQSPYDVYNPSFANKTSGHVLNITWNASPNLTLKSLTGIRLTNRNGAASLTVATSPVNAVSEEFVDSKSFSQELQANYSTDSFNLTMGALYYREKIIDQRDNFVSANCLVFPASSSPVGQLYVGPCVANGFASQQPYRIFGSQLGPFADGFRSQAGLTKSYAAYAQATYTPSILDEKLELTAGLRYSKNTKSAVRTIDRGALLAVPVRNVAETDRFDPAFTVKFNWTPDINTYFRYATGFRDGGANVRSNTFNAYQTESVETYELGLKSQFFGRRVTLNAAVFQNTVSNLQLGLQSALPLNPSITDSFNNPAKNRVRGFELELSVRPVTGLTFSGSYTYLDTSPYFIGINSATLAAFTPEVTETAAGAIIPSAATLLARAGQPLIIAKFNMVGAPKHAGSLGLDYRVPVGSANFLFHADWARSGIFSTSPSVAVTTVSAAGVVSPRPTYNPGVSTNRVNAQIGITDIPLGGTTADIVFWGKNIFDHVDGGYAFGSGNGLSAAQNIAQTTVFLQPPRTYGVDFRIKF